MVSMLSALALADEGKTELCVAEKAGIPVITVYISAPEVSYSECNIRMRLVYGKISKREV